MLALHHTQHGDAIAVRRSHDAAPESVRTFGFPFRLVLIFTEMQTRPAMAMMKMRVMGSMLNMSFSWIVGY